MESLARPKSKGSDVRVKTWLPWFRLGSKGGYLHFGMPKKHSGFLKDGDFLGQLNDHQRLENDQVSRH